MDCHLVLLETSGNQDYIFGTNKLRENVGASELTYRSGTEFALEAVDFLGGPQGLWDKDPRRLRKNLADSSLNPPIENGPTGIEVIVATSGKALVLFREEEKAQRFVQAVTLRAIKEAPGLDLAGVVSDPFDWEQGSLHRAIKSAFGEFEEVRASRPSPRERFQRLPVVEPCSSSGLPGNGLLLIRSETQVRSAPSMAKDPAAGGWMDRIRKIIPSGINIPSNVGELEERFEDLDWTAVVFGDGNGLGRIFLDFDRHAGPKGNRDYADKLRRFSLAIEECTEEAFAKALQWLAKAGAAKSKKRNAKSRILPVVPIILGGDDFTVICDGEYAVPFTQEFLRAFEAATADANRQGGIIPKIAESALGRGNLSACAGIAVTKPHFPFFSAHKLAEELLKSAKAVKKKVLSARGPYPCSAVDFHILYDASCSDLEEIRRRLTVDGGSTHLTAKPYVVTEMGNGWVPAEGLDWAKAHDIDGLEKRIDAINAENNEGRRKLPNSQLHDLREGLFLGREAADARLALIYHRYDDKGLKDLIEGKQSLFRTNGDGQETRFLDAMDAAAFWGR